MGTRVSVYLATAGEVEAALSGAGLGAVRLARRSDRIALSPRTGQAGRAQECLRGAFGRARVADGDVSLPRLLAALLTDAGGTLALAESCTGGLVAKLLTDVPGSSAFLLGAVVAYANEAKSRLLGVPAGLIVRHGAVSRPVVEAMARGAARAFGAGFSLAVSGIAGPDGGTPDKPVGTVWVASLGPGDEVETRSFLFAGGRRRVRELAAANALLMVAERVYAARTVP